MSCLRAVLLLLPDNDSGDDGVERDMDDFDHIREERKRASHDSPSGPAPLQSSHQSLPHDTDEEAAATEGRG